MCYNSQISLKVVFYYYTGYTALLSAANNGHLSIVEYLYEVDKSLVEAKLNNGDNAVNLAAYGGHLEVVKFLVETWGANFDVKNNDGKNALVLASSRSNFDVIEYLLNEHKKQSR